MASVFAIFMASLFGAWIWTLKHQIAVLRKRRPDPVAEEAEARKRVNFRVISRETSPDPGVIHSVARPTHRSGIATWTIE